MLVAAFGIFALSTYSYYRTWVGKHSSNISALSLLLAIGLAVLFSKSDGYETTAMEGYIYGSALLGSMSLWGEKLSKDLQVDPSTALMTIAYTLIIARVVFTIVEYLL